MIGSEVLKEKISLYFGGKIKKYDLGLWAMEAYYELMKGDYIEIEKLKIYHFLKIISTFHMPANDIADEYPCSEDAVWDINEVLEGKKDRHYTFNIRIAKSIYQKDQYKCRFEKFLKLKEILECSDIDEISHSAMSVLIDYANKDIKEIDSLIDLLELNVKNAILENFDFEDGKFDFRQSVGIYTGGSETNKNNFLPDLKKLLNCIMGESYFRIVMVYKKGIANVTLVL